uniref:DUF3800 domain-containing protein n=1 Tax=Panagrellus redivivus TaxID=6233 RepID=A0A7E4V0Z6_PANRE
MSKNSAFKEKANLAFNQMANVNKKKYRFKKCDELLGYELLSENITCYGMRFGRLDRHENFVIRLRCKCRPHEVSDLEKDILKRTKEVAVHAADMLIEHLKKELAAYGFEPQSGLQQPDRLWKHIDDESTMTSLFYYMMILVKPSMFKVQRQGVHDKDVEVMPVSMLYCLILDQRNSQTFREDLVILLRCRSNEVLKQAPKDSLREAAFPLHYQALLRMKNPESYIEGRSAKTRSMI